MQDTTTRPTKNGGSSQSRYIDMTWYTPDYLAVQLRQYRVWHTKKASSAYAQRAGVKGELIAWTMFTRCAVCKHFDADKAATATNGNTYYGVYSYRTLMYGKCMHCGHVEMDVNWYSKATRVLQFALDEAFVDYSVKFKTQEETERQAAAHWIKAGRPRGHNGRPMNLHEKLELFLGRRLPGGFVYLGGALPADTQILEIGGKKYRVKIEEVK